MTGPLIVKQLNSFNCLTVQRCHYLSMQNSRTQKQTICKSRQRRVEDISFEKTSLYSFGEFLIGEHDAGERNVGIEYSSNVCKR